MPGEVCKEVERVMMVRPEVNLGDGNAVRTGYRCGGIQGAAGDDHGGNVGLGQHDGCFIIFLGLRGWSSSVRGFVTTRLKR